MHELQIDIKNIKNRKKRGGGGCCLSTGDNQYKNIPAPVGFLYAIPGHLYIKLHPTVTIG